MPEFLAFSSAANTTVAIEVAKTAQMQINLMARSHIRIIRSSELPPLNRGVPNIMQPNVAERPLSTFDLSPCRNARPQFTADCLHQFRRIERNLCQNRGLRPRCLVRCYIGCFAYLGD